MFKINFLKWSVYFILSIICLILITLVFFREIKDFFTTNFSSIEEKLVDFNFKKKIGIIDGIIFFLIIIFYFLLFVLNIFLFY
jgi:hypothetical protein